MKREIIDRRSFIGLAGVAAAGSALVLAGCASGSDTQPPSDSAAAARAKSPTEKPATSSGSAEKATGSAGKSIIVLWSWSGNTLKMAERLSDVSGAQVYRIEASDPYPDDYDATTERAKQEADDGVYPKIANPLENFEDYDTVYVGYPIWWYGLPMIVKGFVKDHSWSGKTVVPFNSHEGSGDGGTYDDLRDLTGATVLEGLAIRGGDVEDSLDEVNEWYTGLKL